MLWVLVVTHGETDSKSVYGPFDSKKDARDFAPKVWDPQWEGDRFFVTELVRVTRLKIKEDPNG